jgi:hypothetical protein
MKLKQILLAAVVAATCVQEVDWTRFKGTVKGLNLKSNRITVQNAEGDLLGLQVNDDVKILRGKESAEVKLGDVRLDDRVILIHIPADKPKQEESFEEMNRGH